MSKLTKKLLESEIDDKLAKALIEKFVDYKREIDASAQEKAEAAVEEAKEQYSKKLVDAISEKTEQLSGLESEVEDLKKSLSEKVTTFLTNSKTEMRDIIAEDMSLDPEFAKAPRILHEVARLVTPFIEDTTLERESRIKDDKLSALAEEIEQLKGRLARKDESIEHQKAKVRAYELLEDLPDSDKDYFQKKLFECTSATEVDDKFMVLKEKVKSDKDSYIEEEVFTQSKGEIIEEDVQDKAPVDSQVERMRKLSGIN